MEPLESPEFTPEQKRNAQQNARDIERTLLKLVRIFSRKEMRDKLIKEFGVQKQNEIIQFNEQFSELKKLWTFKLTTPLEEVLSVQEQLNKLKTTTTALKETLRTKEDSFQKFQQAAREQREQRQHDLEDLKKMQIDKQTKRKTDEERLNDIGDQIRKQREEEHLKRKAELEKKLSEMRTQLEKQVAQNKTEEDNQYKAFDGADVGYTTALETYDAELNQQSAELKTLNKELDDKYYELNQLKTEWEQRLEENRKQKEI